MARTEALKLEKDNLNNEIQACTAILNYLKETVLENVEAKKKKNGIQQTKSLKSY